MSTLMLKSIDVGNFRSIRGQIHAPLDANVVLVHGENGAGKTSLLSAVELALTGRIQSLGRADPGYEKQLLHRSATDGSVVLRTVEGASEQDFVAHLNATGAQPIATLDDPRAAFFRERAFLPQSLLGQLLQIYQDAGSDSVSPLAQFVSKLLGLDRLDALEAGLKPLGDIRNVRKNVDGWLAAENEKAQLDAKLAELRQARSHCDGEVKDAIRNLAALCTALDLSAEVREDALDTVAALVSENKDTDAFARLMDQQRRLASIVREIDAAQTAVRAEEVQSPAGADAARAAFGHWEAEYGKRVSALRARIGALLPAVSLSDDPSQLAEAALVRLTTEQKQLALRISQARADIVRHAAALDERDVAQRQRTTIEEEVSRLPSSAGSLAAALAELTSFIVDEHCPVCDRDFREVGVQPLSEHVHGKVRVLSASAERLIMLGRTRSEVQVTIERLDREIETIAARKVEEQVLAELDRQLASVVALIGEIESLTEALRQGALLRAADIAARRAVSEAQARHVSLAAARETLHDFSLSIGATGLEEGESFNAGAERMKALLDGHAARLEQRLATRRNAIDRIASTRQAIRRREDIDHKISAATISFQRADQALQRAQALREDGNVMRSAVDRIRSAIIRKEFNDRLNRVWRDLFVRLAPGEPFVPSFRIPASSTQKLQPKLITEHRDGGDAGGTPGAMLSAGNLNTAALTLFIALHLSVPRQLPWLILDDPVQSMDDVHIAQFAALVRTLSKEHNRQVMIAVHDRQLFEYLKLELSPAFQDDSLLTLELSRGPRRDTVCLATRFSFKQETALLAAA